MHHNQTKQCTKSSLEKWIVFCLHPRLGKKQGRSSSIGAIMDGSLIYKKIVAGPLSLSLCLCEVGKWGGGNVGRWGVGEVLRWGGGNVRRWGGGEV